ncbi:unnamed protein product [Ixodes pacificus]
MHLVCLGVMRRLIAQYWTSPTPSASKLPIRSQLEISDKLISFQSSTHCEFNRKPRPLKERDPWKAVEFQSFLLYFGPVLLRSNFDKRFYTHFLKLSCAMTILASPKFSLTHCDVAESLLIEFVRDAGSLYADGVYDYTVHSLINLAQDVRRFGPVNLFSAFPFEYFLWKLKRMVRGRALALQQVLKRHSKLNAATKTTHEQQKCDMQGPHRDGP